MDGRGIVTGVGLGTTTIRATSVLDSTVYATCTVHVKQLSVTVNGILRDSDKLGTPKFYTWNMETGDPYVVGNTLKNPPMAVTRVPETDTFYLLDAEHGTMHLLDQDGKDLVEPADHYYQQNYWICGALFHAAEHVLGPAGLFEKYLARRRQFDDSPPSVKKLDAYLVFQILDQVADRALRDVQRRTGRREAAELRDHQKGIYLTNGDIHSSSRAAGGFVTDA